MRKQERGFPGPGLRGVIQQTISAAVLLHGAQDARMQTAGAMPIAGQRRWPLYERLPNRFHKMHMVQPGRTGPRGLDYLAGVITARST